MTRDEVIFSLDVRRARKGDCLLLHYGTPADPGLVLIDGGPAQVYGPHLKPRLDALRAARNAGENDPLALDMIMVSHIDDDHVSGLLEMTSDLVAAQDARRPLPLKVRGFWHNTFDDIIGNSPDELLAAVRARFGAAALSGEAEVEGLDPSVAQVLASVGQGFRLRDDARKLRFRINPQHGGRLVMAGSGSVPVDAGKGLTLTVVGPMRPQLEALQKSHDEFLRKRAERQPDASLAAFSDRSVPNLSSIVVLAEVGGRRMLLTGDARGDRILEGLELVALLEPGGTVHVDVLKMPHHGSDRNMEVRFLERVVADHYVFSGNGEHGNPERATLEMLQAARGDADYTIHLTYPIEEIDVERKKNREKEQAKARARQATNPEAKVPEDWSPEKHSLTAFFAASPEMAQKVRVVPEPGHHLIELLDPLGI